MTKRLPEQGNQFNQNFLHGVDEIGIGTFPEAEQRNQVLRMEHAKWRDLQSYKGNTVAKGRKNEPSFKNLLNCDKVCLSYKGSCGVSMASEDLGLLSYGVSFSESLTPHSEPKRPGMVLGSSLLWLREI